MKIAFVLSVTCCILSSEKVNVDNPMPEFTLEYEAYDCVVPDNLKGKVVLVNLFAKFQLPIFVYKQTNANQNIPLTHLFSKGVTLVYAKYSTAKFENQIKAIKKTL